jgi:ribosomal protein L37E
MTEETRARAAWMSRLFTEYNKSNKYCPTCGHTLLVVSDSMNHKGEYIVRRYCSACRVPSEARFDQKWVTLTIARIRRSEGQEGVPST